MGIDVIILDTIKGIVVDNYQYWVLTGTGIGVLGGFLAGWAGRSVSYRRDKHLRGQ